MAGVRTGLAVGGADPHHELPARSAIPYSAPEAAAVGGLAGRVAIYRADHVPAANPQFLSGRLIAATRKNGHLADQVGPPVSRIQRCGDGPEGWPVYAVARPLH